MLKTVFMGTPLIAATILESLCKNGIRPDLVITQTAKASGRGQKVIPSAVEQAATVLSLEVMATDNVNAGSAFERLRNHQPDLILVAAFGQILKEAILHLPKIACLNVHASLLPKYRGAAPYQRAIWNGDKVTGITVQRMARKLDTGDILLQKELSIFPQETAGELLDRLAVLGGECLVEAVRKIELGNYTFTPQDESQATYAAKLDKSDANMDWTKCAEFLHNQIRALQPWPVAQTSLGDTQLKLFRSEITPGKPGVAPGTIHTDHRTFLQVQCGDGRALSLTEIQLENRKRLDIKGFLLGYRGNFPFLKVGK